MATSFIGIGSNLGNREAHIANAIDILGASEALNIHRVSSIYETEPVGGPVGQRTYLNGVMQIETTLTPPALLRYLGDVEKALNRERTVRHGPRTIDLDILMYEDMVVRQADLEIPHPRLHQRAFVLQGFCEIAPDVVHPVLKKSIRDIYDEIQK